MHSSFQFYEYEVENMSGYTHRYNVRNFGADVAAAVNAPLTQSNVQSRERKERIAEITNEFGNPSTWEEAPNNIANRAERERVEKNQERAALMLSTPSEHNGLTNEERRAKFIENHPLPIRRHGIPGIPGTVRRLGNNGGARRRTRRTRKNKTRKTRSNRR